MFVAGARRGEPPGVFGTSYPDYLDLAREQHSFEALATSCYWTFTVTSTDVPLRLVGQRVSGSFFPLLGLRPLHGRWIDETDDRLGGAEVVVLSHGLWQRVFGGDPAAVGGHLMLNGRSAEVVGVMPPAFAFPFEDLELWAPMLGEMEGVPRNSRFFSTIGRLRDDVPRVEAQAEVERLAAALERQHPGTNRDWRPVLIEALPALTTDARPRLLLIFAAVLVVLLVACVNLAALLVSRTAARQRELAVRVALGAGRWRLGRILLCDAGWLGIAGLAGGWLIAAPSLALLKALAPEALPRVDTVSLSWPVAALAAASMVVFVGVGAVAPLATLRPHRVVRPGSATVAGRAGGLGRRVLITVQIAGAFALLIAVGLLGRSFARVLDVSPGFDAANLITLRVFLTPPAYRTIEQQIDFVSRGLEALRHSPGVIAAAAVTQPPFDAQGAGTTLPTAVEGRTYAPGTQPIVAYRGVSAGYFATVGLPVLDGRPILETDRRGAPLVGVINRAMADQLWPGERPIGRRFEFADGRNAGWITVVGVVGDVATDGLEMRESPAVYTPYGQRSLPFLRWMTLVVRTNGDPGTAVASVRARLQQVDPQQPIFAVTTMEATMARSMAERRFAVVLMTVFAGLAIVIAALGVYGMLAQQVASRAREIGVRLALGARPGQVFATVIREGAGVSAVGVALGAGLTAVAAPLIESSLFGITTADPTTYGGGLLAIALMTVVASTMPALTAARTDPIGTLRSD